MSAHSDKTWRLLVHPPGPASWLMAVDEALAYSVRSGRSVPVLRFYQWERPSLSLGYFQRLRSAVHLRRCNRLGIPVVRRITGGRAILHDDDLTYAVMGPVERSPFPRGIHPTYARISEALASGLRMAGIPCTFKLLREERSRSEPISRSPVCFQSLSFAEISADNRKIVGSAQKRWTDGFLQHGSIPLSVPLEHIHTALKFPSAAIRSRSIRETPVLMAGIREFQPSLTPAGLIPLLRAGFEQTFGITLEPDVLSGEEAAHAEGLVGTRYGNPAWTGMR